MAKANHFCFQQDKGLNDGIRKLKLAFKGIELCKPGLLLAENNEKNCPIKTGIYSQKNEISCNENTFNVVNI